MPEGGGQGLVAELSHAVAHLHAVEQHLAFADEVGKVGSVGVELAHGVDGLAQSLDVGFGGVVGSHDGFALVELDGQGVGLVLKTFGGGVLRGSLVDAGLIHLESAEGEEVAARLVGLYLIAQILIFLAHVDGGNDGVGEFAHVEGADEGPVAVALQGVGGIDGGLGRTLQLAPFAGAGIFLVGAAALVEEAYHALRGLADVNLDIAASLHVGGVALIDEELIPVGPFGTLLDYGGEGHLVVSRRLLVCSAGGHLDEALAGVGGKVEELGIEAAALLHQVVELAGAVGLLLVFHEFVDSLLVGDFPHAPCPLLVGLVADLHAVVAVHRAVGLVGSAGVAVGAHAPESAAVVGGHIP